MADGLDQLPTWLQTTLSSAAALGAAAFAVYGWTKKKTQEIVGDHAKSDTVLISGALADGNAIRDFTDAIKRLVSQIERDNDVMERVCRTNERIADSNDRINQTMQTLRDDVQKIRDDRRN